MKNLTDFRKTVETGVDPPLISALVCFINCVYSSSYQGIGFYDPICVNTSLFFRSSIYLEVACSLLHSELGFSVLFFPLKIEF